ncbi:hypothetical protein [Paenibacillus hunanensis]|uniref:hypothetical protein n=1 Tax=Paenibacillus hunanensis TaxID=539262 RepID=UPI00286D2FE2|nr:hypothetical protein [Paenibacillus hunanensis]
MKQIFDAHNPPPFLFAPNMRNSILPQIQLVQARKEVQISVTICTSLAEHRSFAALRQIARFFILQMLIERIDDPVLSVDLFIYCDLFYEATMNRV